MTLKARIWSKISRPAGNVDEPLRSVTLSATEYEQRKHRGTFLRAAKG